MKEILFVVLITILGISTQQKCIEDKISVEIQIIDGYNTPIIGAYIEVEVKKGEILSFISDIEGKVSIKIEEGNYQVKASYIGYKTQTKMYYFSLSKSKVKIKMVASEKLNKVVIAETESFGLGESPSMPSMRMSKASDMAYTSYVPEKGKKSSMGSAEFVAGQITAGEWNDLQNWEKWINLMEDEGYSKMEEYWTIFTDQRFSVLVLNKQDQPIQNVKLFLEDNSGLKIWEAISDVSGHAELWGNSFGGQKGIGKIRGNYKGKKFSIIKPQLIKDKVNVVRIDEFCSEVTEVDIAFVVDATGSMADEIQYLQSELKDVIERSNVDKKVFNYASVFYRDKGEEYETKSLEFSYDSRKLSSFIDNQYAAGGGDFPEAVSDALKVGIEDLKWSETSQVKLMFLLLDAPPHADYESMTMFKKYLKIASSKGIKIIPITASGIDRETEFLMKFTAMMTNATYVFITDDSGIGNPHLNPVVKDYEVEKLNDLIVRVITSYTSSDACNTETENVAVSTIVHYPNPASQFINIEGQKKGDEFHLISTSGRRLLSLTNVEDGRLTMNIANMISGSYILRHISGEKSADYPLLIIT